MQLRSANASDCFLDRKMTNTYTESALVLYKSAETEEMKMGVLSNLEPKKYFTILKRSAGFPEGPVIRMESAVI